MTIKEGTLTNKSATLVLTNNSDKNFQYGNTYERAKAPVTEALAVMNNFVKNNNFISL